MERIIYDTFTDDDATLITDHSPDTRPDLDTEWGIYGALEVPKIASNKLIMDDDLEFGANIDAGRADALCRCDFTTGSEVTSGAVGLILRSDDSDYLLAKLDHLNELAIYSFIGGVLTKLANTTLTWVASTSYTMEFGAVGNWCRVICKYGTTEVMCEYEGLTDLLTNTLVGIYMAAVIPSGTYNDANNFSVVSMDAWNDSSLAGLTLQTAKALTCVAREGKATGGSLTTLLDTGLLEPDDYLTHGVLWLLDGFYQGQAMEVTDWDAATYTATFATRYGRVYIGDRYVISNCDFPLWLLDQCVDQAMVNMGRKLYHDTSLTTVTNQMSYTLPDGINRTNFKSLEIAIGISAPLQYAPHYFYDIIGNNLFFPAGAQPDGGYNMRITYADLPGALNRDADTVPGEYNPLRVASEAAVLALRWRVARTGGQEKIYSALLSDAESRAMELARVYPLPRKMRQPRFRYWGGS